MKELLEKNAVDAYDMSASAFLFAAQRNNKRRRIVCCRCEQPPSLDEIAIG